MQIVYAIKIKRSKKMQFKSRCGYNEHKFEEIQTARAEIQQFAWNHLESFNKNTRNII